MGLRLSYVADVYQRIEQATENNCSVSYFAFFRIPACFEYNTKCNIHLPCFAYQEQIVTLLCNN
uniref:Uncharacterized protein n=1 Tax=Anopheles minimus TaxID=112268 RepID=A0A182WPI8_9DIPT